jgi:hypothetical protein
MEICDLADLLALKIFRRWIWLLKCAAQTKVGFRSAFVALGHADVTFSLTNTNGLGLAGGPFAHSECRAQPTKTVLQ